MKTQTWKLATVAVLASGLAVLAGCERIPGNQSELNTRAAEAKTGCALAADAYNTLAGGGAGKETQGAFTEPFCEENFFSDYSDEEVGDAGAGTMGLTNPLPLTYENLEHCAQRADGKIYECKPTAGSIALLPDNRLVYFNALENTENAEVNAYYEAGEITINDQTRVVDLGQNGVASWSRPLFNDSGAVNPTIQPGAGVILPGVGNINIGTTPDDVAQNDGALFCAHLVNMHDGRVLAAGGTDYYTELGLVELEGLKNARAYDPASNSWTQLDPMSWGRWYPTMVTLANGNIFIASGVRKLLKPVYLDRPQDSGRNETHTEIFQSGCNDGKGKWTDNGADGQKSLPLFARLHLLPNNQVYYTASGQAYNPLGQSYDEVLWNFASAYDPATNTWTDLGIPGANSLYPGFRGSTSSILMPLVPDAEGHYSSANIMTMGGTILPTPGSAIPIAHTRIDTLSLAGGLSMSSRSVGALNRARWFGQAILLPTGQVMIFSGADIDEVLAPGLEGAITVTEMYDPVSETWSTMAEQGKRRTYHNSAIMLPDGRVLVGGHAPIPTANAVYFDIPTRGPAGRDSTFEIYSPPYVFKDRPSISGVSASSVMPGDSLTISTPNAAAVADGGYVVLVRRGAVTHLVDGDQRNVVLPITSSTGDSLTVRIPSNDAALNEAVLPPGHYMLFIVTGAGADAVPSISAPVQVAGADLSCR